MYSSRYTCKILMKLDLIRQIFEKYSNVKFNETRSLGFELFYADGRTEKRTDGQTDRETHDEANYRF